MDTALFIIYYFCIFVGIIVYLKKRRKLLTMSDFLVLDITVVFSFSGYFISHGSSLGYDNLDIMLYLIYLLFGLIVPIGLIIGNRIKICSSYEPVNYHISDKLINYLTIFLFIYSIGFFYIIRDNIPLLLLIKGEALSSVKIARLQVTHTFISNYDIPFIYNYKGIIFDYLSLYLYAIYLIRYLSNKKKYRYRFYVTAAYVALLQFYATEKAGLFYIMIVSMVCIYHIKTNNGNTHFINKAKIINDLRKKVLIFIPVFIGLYIYFMGKTDLKSGLESLFSRLFVSQSSEIYFQKIILDNEFDGCLYGAGMPLTLVDKLLGRTPVNLSRMVYGDLYSTYTDSAGGAGTSGSMPFFDLYANFGFILAIIMVFIIAIYSSYLDKKICKWINDSVVKEIPIAYYSMITLIFFQGYMGHFQTFFALPFIIGIPYLIIVILNLMFWKVKIK